jgi:CRISPR-associated protein Csb3
MIRVNVDPTNPGQFFACCGLLELADRLWPGAEGYFAESGREFHITCGGSLGEVLNSLMECELTNTMTCEQQARLAELGNKSNPSRKIPGAEEEKKSLEKMKRENPILFMLNPKLEINWFLDNFAGGSRFKTWAGQQSVLDISQSMKSALNGDGWRNEHCLAFSVTGSGLPFNFDSDLGGQGGAMDVGFSIDSLAGNSLTRIDPPARPALELLAFIGLQRFRPLEIKGENRFLYTVWKQSLPIQVAQPAACGAMPKMGSQLEFRLLYRTKYLKSFLPAIPFSGASDE